MIPVEIAQRLIINPREALGDLPDSEWKGIMLLLASGLAQHRGASLLGLLMDRARKRALQNEGGFDGAWHFAKLMEELDLEIH